MTANRVKALGTITTGTNEVQTLTIGGTPTGGTFKLRFESVTTSAITWSATNGTLLANIQAALDAHPSLGTNGCVASAGTLTAGIGTILLTFGAARAKQAVETISVFANNLTGTSPTLAIVETTPGVNATGLYDQFGQMGYDTAGIVYINTSTGVVASYVKVGTQT